MQLANAPGQLTLPFAGGGAALKNTIPVPSQIGITPAAASYTDGFPPITMQSYLSGGIPPSGLDFNGILNAMSATEVWACAGGGFAYNSTFSTAIGGYPKGARVLRADGTGYWFSTVDNNLTDPDTGGAGWTAITPTLHKQVFTASGTFTVPTGANASTAFRWLIVGGGGAGSNQAAGGAGGGGGAGGTARVLATGYTVGDTITVTVGAAGAASGISSGTQTITTVTAGAGAAGSPAPASGYGGAGGAGGTTINGDANSSKGGDGSPGCAMTSALGCGGNGGASSQGGGGMGAVGFGSAVNGAAGEAYGSGGGGANAQTGAVGGAGAAGLVVVEWVL